MNAPPATQTTYRIPVEGEPTATTCKGRKITVTCVDWRVYIDEGEMWLTLTAFADDFDNVSWVGTGAAALSALFVPSWVPRPPVAWFDLAREIAAQAVQS